MERLRGSVSSGGTHLAVELDFVPTAVPLARSIVRRHAGDSSPRVRADAELLTSEVVSNAVMHGAPPLRLAVLGVGDDLVVRISDGSSVVPTVRSGALSLDAVGGRGLRIVADLAFAWGVDVDQDDDGKTVWFRVTAETTGRHNNPTQQHRTQETDLWI
ncbi:hypothetical protein JCM18899A_26780 [Nocardioides sp. AN3]